MKNKTIKKYILSLIILLIFNVSLIFILNRYEYKMYTKNYNDKINTIISNIKNKYPDIEESDIIEIINSEEDCEDILNNYGIDSITKNDKVNNKVRIISLIIIIIIVKVPSSGTFNLNHNSISRSKTYSESDDKSDLKEYPNLSNF